MTKKNDDSSPAESIPGADPPSAGALKLLAGLGAASALWAVFLWRELVRARAGETPFCGFSESADCGTLWSAAFAETVHAASGVPVAGWGLAWGLVATLLPLLALARRAREDRDAATSAAAAAAATELTAAAGVAGVVVLLAASAAEGLFCTSCAATYVLTLAYAAVAFVALSRRAARRPPHGVTLAVAVTVAAYLVLLYPGLKTPKSLSEEGQRALAAAAESREAEDDPPAPAEGDATSTPVPDRRYDDKLRDFLASLPPPALQGLSDSLYLFRNAPALEPEEPRALAAGSPSGRVLITEFTDVLCSHCATLHQTMAYLSTLLPPESFRLDARQFPLDGNCNPHLRVRGPESVRCMAARAQICLEDSGRAPELAGVLFENQRDLTTEQAFELTAPFLDRAALEACMSDPATERKLRYDVDYAWRYRPEGTPLVLIDGRRGTQFPPFLYAMVLTGGDADHPAFATLPPPSAQLAEGSG